MGNEKGEFGMKMQMVVAALFLVQTLNGIAGTFPGATSRTPLVSGRVSDRVSVGIGYDRIERGIDLDRGLESTLEANSVSGYAGLDVLPWLTVFVTAGSVELDSDSGIDTDPGLKISGGLNAYLWEADVLVPAFMAGRLSLKVTAELARFESDTAIGKASWMEAIVALPLGYEKFDSYATGSTGLETSLALYAGPAVSYLDGSLGTPFGDVNFDGSELVGLVAGMDVYFSPQVSVGAQVTVFDEVSYGASMRFHF